MSYLESDKLLCFIASMFCVDKLCEEKLSKLRSLCEDGGRRQQRTERRNVIPCGDGHLAATRKINYFFTHKNCFLREM